MPFLELPEPPGGGGGGSAPSSAQVWLAAAHADFASGKNLGALTTGLVKNTSGTPSTATGGTTSGDYSLVFVGSTLPSGHGTASAGVSTEASRADHVHPTTGLVASSRQIIAGAGLTGGGDLSADRTLNVAAADSTITVTADAIAVGTINTANINNSQVTLAKIANSSAGLVVLGRSLNSIGVYVEIAAVSGQSQVLRETGGGLAFGQIVNACIDPSAAITHTKLANLAGASVLGRPEAGAAGSMSAITGSTIGHVLTVQGDNTLAFSAPAGGMSIGASVTSGTAKSVLFVGTGPVLAQDNTNFQFDDTADRLIVKNANVGSGLVTATTHSLIVSDAADRTQIKIRTTSASNAAGIEFYDSSDNQVGSLGYYNASDTPAGVAAWHSNGINFHWIGNSGSSHHVFQGNGLVGILNTAPSGEALCVGSSAFGTGGIRIGTASGTIAYLAIDSGGSSAVSASNQGRFRYDAGTQKMQLSVNGGAYADVATGTGGGVTAGAGAASGRTAFWTSATEINGSTRYLYDDTAVSLTVGDLTSALPLTLHLKSGTDQDCKILWEENGHSAKPWYLAVDASDSHKLVLGHNSSTPGSGTITLKIQSSSGDIEALTDWNFTKAGTQNFTKEGTGNIQFRTSATGQEISFRPKLIETMVLTDDGVNGISRHFGNTAINGNGSFGSGVGVLFIGDRATAPTTNPSGGGIMYSESGGLKWRDSAGVVTALT